MGPFFRPGRELYPHQWNWDSAFIALGLAQVDPERGRAEVRSLLKGQWSDGMVPHIVFHIPAPDYFPGPELWDSRACEGAPEVPTSGLTQPPVLATAVRVLHENVAGSVVPGGGRSRARAMARVVASRARHDGGLIAIVHPWEGADNSPRFDRALARLEVDEELEIERTDRREIDSSERPTDSDYARYLFLVRRLQAQGYRPPSLGDTPFVFVDLTFNSILARAEADLAWLWAEMGGDGARASAAAERLAGAGRPVERFRAIYVEDDDDPATADETIDGLFPLYAGVPTREQARRLFEEALWAPARFGPSPEAPWAVTSASKASPAFDPRRYWRGPVWVNVNWFFVQGLERAGLLEEADELRRMTLELVGRSGFFEYYDPRSGEPLGVSDFSWSAALTLDLLLRSPA